MPFKVHSHGVSDLGLVRTNNEDAWFASPDGRVFLVADGLGGHQAGEVAAREAIDQFLIAFLDTFQSQPKEPLIASQIVEGLQTCYAATNAHVFALACSHELLRGMGTTFCALTFHDDLVAISHVGDSRVYRIRDGILELFTKDHCWTRSIFIQPDSEDHASKGVLTRAIGTLPEVEPTIRIITPEHDDLFLLCTDGLSDMLSHEEIESALNRPITIGEKARLLVSTAKQKGGGDNITIVLVEVSKSEL